MFLVSSAPAEASANYPDLESTERDQQEDSQSNDFCPNIPHSLCCTLYSLSRIWQGLWLYNLAFTINNGLINVESS